MQGFYFAMFLSITAVAEILQRRKSVAITYESTFPLKFNSLDFVEQAQSPRLLLFKYLTPKTIPWCLVELLASNINTYSKSIIFQFLQRIRIAHMNSLSLVDSHK